MFKKAIILVGGIVTSGQREQTRAARAELNEAKVKKVKGLRK